jgi:hypothetical protein
MVNLSNCKRMRLCTGCFTDINTGLDIEDGCHITGYFRCGHCGRSVTEGYRVIVNCAPESSQGGMPYGTENTSKRQGNLSGVRGKSPSKEGLRHF